MNGLGIVSDCLRAPVQCNSGENEQLRIMMPINRMMSRGWCEQPEYLKIDAVFEHGWRGNLRSKTESLFTVPFFERTYLADSEVMSHGSRRIGDE